MNERKFKLAEKRIKSLRTTRKFNQESIRGLKKENERLLYEINIWQDIRRNAEKGD